MGPWRAGTRDQAKGSQGRVSQPDNNKSQQLRSLFSLLKYFLTAPAHSEVAFTFKTVFLSNTEYVYSTLQLSKNCAYIIYSSQHTGNRSVTNIFTHTHTLSKRRLVEQQGQDPHETLWPFPMMPSRRQAVSSSPSWSFPYVRETMWIEATRCLAPVITQFLL